MSNPLTSYMRQPKVYIKLPSNGRFWPEGSIDMPASGEFPVYSMTAKDEITLKTPDALLNGQAVVDIIQSCFPNIKNAWATPNIDIDTLLVALRIATYGEMMEINHTVPGTTDDVTHTVDLRLILDQLSNAGNWQDTVELGDNLRCFLQPLTYMHIAKSSMKTFEAQRLMQLLTNEEIPEEQRIELLNQSVNTMSEVTLDLVVDSIRAIQSGDELVEDKEFIKEFLQNSDKINYNKIEQHLAAMKELVSIKPLEFNSSPEHIEQGAPAKYTMPLNMDQSSFFVPGS